MLTIGSMPRKIKGFFKPLRPSFGRPAFGHFWRLVLAICVCHGATIDTLVRAMASPCHRTKHGEFLWKSTWDSSAVVRAIALDTLKRLRARTKANGTLYFVIDETQTLKRGKKMAAVGKLYHHATRRYAKGHTMLKVCLWYQGVSIPWGTWLYVKKEHAPKLKLTFRTLTDLAAAAIDQARLPSRLKVLVLFDAYYLCPKVTDACRRRGWHFIGVAKSNRRFCTGGTWRKLGDYGRNVLKRGGQWHSIKGLCKTGKYRLAERTGKLKKLDEVKVVFSKRQGENKMVALVTDDLHAPMRSVVADYLKRWCIELLIKEEKQQLGLGDYRVLRYEAVVRHLHLVDCAYGCLTRLALQGRDEQGKRTKKALHLPAISQLKNQMRQVVWRERVEDVIRCSHEKPVIRRLEKLLAA